jgi:hypothetical protein
LFYPLDIFEGLHRKLRALPSPPPTLHEISSFPSK